jgi:hypothetical protein
MAINPALEGFVAAGLYDSLNSCAVNDALVALEAGVRRRRCSWFRGARRAHPSDGGLHPGPCAPAAEVGPAPAARQI